METMLRAHLPGGAFRGVTARRSRHMAAIRGSGNRSTEQCLRLAMVRAGLRGWKVRPVRAWGHPDFWFAATKMAVFVDGCFWHGCPRCGHVPRTRRRFWKAKLERNQARDKLTTMRLRRQGLAVLRFWEHEVQQDAAGCIQRVTQALKRRQR